MANYASPLQQQFVRAYKDKDTLAFAKYSQQFIVLIGDLDQLLRTRQDFLLGPWVASARRWGNNEVEKALYEFNAKDLITLWGDKECPLNEYACRQWSGLLNDFYKPRWQQFFARASLALREGKDMDMEAFRKEIKDWEWQWVHQRRDYSLSASGDPIAVARAMYQKYRSVIGTGGNW